MWKLTKAEDRAVDPFVTLDGARKVLHPLAGQIEVRPLTPASFKPFGYVVEDAEYPHVPKRSEPRPQASQANQGSAKNKW